MPSPISLTSVLVQLTIVFGCRLHLRDQFIGRVSIIRSSIHTTIRLDQVFANDGLYRWATSNNRPPVLTNCSGAEPSGFTRRPGKASSGRASRHPVMQKPVWGWVAVSHQAEQRLAFFVERGIRVRVCQNVSRTRRKEGNLGIPDW